MTTITQLPMEAVIAAQCCQKAYTNKDGGLLARFPFLEYSPKNGFGAMLSEIDDGTFILAFRGTIVSSLISWMQDIQQALDMDTSQYDQALSLAQKIKQPNKRLLLVGHSLGGGLAAAASYATGCDAITFNAAGLSERYKQGTPGSIVNYYIPGEILTELQDGTSIPDAVGTQIAFDPPSGLPASPIKRHAIINFLQPAPRQTPA